MVKDYSLDALNRFLDYALEKGLLKSETAKSRKTAVNKILEKITDEQRTDVRKVDLELEADHFANRQGAGYIATSLQTYKSRAKTSLADFVAYVDNPMHFRPSAGNGKVQSKSAGAQTIRKAKQSKPLAAAYELSGARGIQRTDDYPSSDDRPTLTFPIPIRPGLIVQLNGIPFDLTAGEAEKIAQVVRALANNP